MKRVRKGEGGGVGGGSADGEQGGGGGSRVVAGAVEYFAGEICAAGGVQGAFGVGFGDGAVAAVVCGADGAHRGQGGRGAQG
ncbi:hypothetical protein PORY_000558 [Pneumocystis oryctolagi]|uniref:Uncharacterized protein n=1 Tax=Pneumocystis oryctolagi TaxID=42067 RepID=A0ACB7CGH0_9ASCO|nr:hypothetical protein PORY_000558 [Pneumocystis oryctolagi]